MQQLKHHSKLQQNYVYRNSSFFLRCCYSCRKQDPRFGPVLEDNCCQCNFSAVKQTLGDFFENVDIVYTSFVDEVSL